MDRQIEYFVDGKAFGSKVPEPTVAHILEAAGKSPGLFVLVSAKGVDYVDPDAKVALQEGEQFTTRKRAERPDASGEIHYKVNGEPQTTRDATLTVAAILRNAGRAASIDLNELGNYFLERLNEDQKYTDLGANVTIKEGDEFFAIHVGKTPVA